MYSTASATLRRQEDQIKKLTDDLEDAHDAARHAQQRLPEIDALCAQLAEQREVCTSYNCDRRLTHHRQIETSLRSFLAGKSKMLTDKQAEIIELKSAVADLERQNARNRKGLAKLVSQVGRAEQERLTPSPTKMIDHDRPLSASPTPVPIRSESPAKQRQVTQLPPAAKQSTASPARPAPTKAEQASERLPPAQPARTQTAAETKRYHSANEALRTSPPAATTSKLIMTVRANSADVRQYLIFMSRNSCLRSRQRPAGP